MKSGGIILTYIDWSDRKEFFFNVILFVMQLIGLVIGKIIRKVKVKWRQIWKAAQVSHVRLALWEAEPLIKKRPWVCINFGYPTAELQPWYDDWIDGKRFEYRDPTFNPSPEFIDAMDEYAHAQVGKRYDELQLLSGAVNLIIWIIYPPSWGREVIKWFNRPGGLEFCSSGVTACLRAAEKAPRRAKTLFFKTYHTAMVSPSLFAISENWKGI